MPAPGSTAIIEFSRGSEHGGYRSALPNLSDAILQQAAILYIDVSWEESLRKNRRRFNPARPDSILEHGLPDAKLERLYRRDDWRELRLPAKGRLEIGGHRVPYVVFDNEDDVTTRAGPGPGTAAGRDTGQTLARARRQAANHGRRPERSGLKPGREKSILHHHPWIFSGAIAPDRRLARSRATRWRCWPPVAAGWPAARYSPRSQIAVRLYTWRQDEPLDEQSARGTGCAGPSLCENRLGLARIASAYRLVNAESDLLPGLVVDRYGDYPGPAGPLGRGRAMEGRVRRAVLRRAAAARRASSSAATWRCGPRRACEKTAGVLRGSRTSAPAGDPGERPPLPGGRGQRATRPAFYLDQRENRRKRRRASAPARTFSTRSRTPAASASTPRSAGAAQVRPPGQLGRRAGPGPAQRGAEHAACDAASTSSWRAMPSRLLRGFRAAGRTFDVIILDPPKFAESAGQLARALNGYKDINLVALQILQPGRHPDHLLVLGPGERGRLPAGGVGGCPGRRSRRLYRGAA